MPETNKHIIGPLQHLGTVWWIELFDASDENIDCIQQGVVAHIQQFEQRYSRFREDSWLSVLNRNGAVDDADGEFVDMVHYALDAYQQTKGVFNIAIGEYLVRSGYDKDYSFESSQQQSAVPELDTVLAVDGDSIVLKGGAQIDFGGFGKGYLIDSIVRYLAREWGVHHCLVNGGGDMYATNQDGKAVTIGLQHPTNREHMLGSLDLLNTGFAASSPFVRSWRDQHGVEHNHLVGEGEKQAVFVTAPTATQADMWATALSIDQTLVPPVGVKYRIV